MIVVPAPHQSALHVSATSLRQRAEISASLARIKRARGELRRAEAYEAEADNLREVATYLDAMTRGEA